MKKLLLLLLVVATSAWGDQFRRFQRNDSGGASAPLLSFAPPSGAGMGTTACPAANFITYSEMIGNWSQAGNPVTVTENYAANPIDGAQTADRVQFAAIGVGVSSMLISGTPTLPFQSTLSFWIKGNGSSGQIDMARYSPTQCQLCYYNASTWSLCSFTATTSGSIEIGNDGSNCGSGPDVAKDVLIYGVAVNPGTSRAPYIATTAQAKGFMPTAATDLGTNWLPYSQQLNLWTNNGATITADAFTAPDGTLSAERVVFPATPTTSWVSNSMGFQNPCPMGTCTGSIWVYGNGSSGTLDLMLAGPNTTAPCNYTNGAWTQCTRTDNYKSSFYIGQLYAYNGNAVRPAIDVYLWGGEVATGSTPLSKRFYTANYPNGSTALSLRNSGAMCTKYSQTTEIQNGDMVYTPYNTLRIANPDGTYLKVQQENARINTLLYSQALSTAPWTAASGVVSMPTVTADNGVAPDNSTVAERIDLPAVSGLTEYSVNYQNFTATALPWTGSCYVRGVSSSGTTYLTLGTGGGYTTTPCNYTTTGWNRCAVTATATAASWYLQLGVDRRDSAQAAQPAQSYYATFCQVEAGSFATSYIPTTSAQVSRTSDTAAVGIPPTDFQNGYSYSSDSYVFWTVPYNSAVPLDVYGFTGLTFRDYVSTSGAYGMEGTSCSRANPSVIGPGKMHFGSWGYANTQPCGMFFNGVSQAGTQSVLPTTPGHLVGIGGSYAYGNRPIDGFTGNICVSNSATRCR